MLLLFPNSVKKESSENELAFMRYMEGVPTLDKMSETLKSLCLHLATSSSGKNKHDVKREREEKNLMGTGE